MYILQASSKMYVTPVGVYKERSVTLFYLLKLWQMFTESIETGGIWPSPAIMKYYCIFNEFIVRKRGQGCTKK